MADSISDVSTASEAEEGSHIRGCRVIRRRGCRERKSPRSHSFRSAWNDPRDDRRRGIRQLDEALRAPREPFRSEEEPSPRALPWAFFPDRLSHDFDEADEKHGRFVVCCVCHPGGLQKSAASSLSGGKQTGVFRYHWRTGQRSITDHVSKKHADALEALTKARDEHVRKHGENGALANRDDGVGGKRGAGDVSDEIDDDARFFPLVKDGPADGIGTDSDETPAAKQAKTGRGGARTGAGRPRQECPDVIDMRSDTVTKPTPAMRRAMAEAEVGDDVFGDDPTVIKLEEEMAKTLGKAAALFVPSGTMGNLIAVGVHCEVRGSEFICGSLSHIHIYEQGGLATLMGAHPRPLTNRTDGTLDMKEIAAAIRPNDQHFPVTKVLCLEQTTQQVRRSRAAAGLRGQVRRVREGARHRPAPRRRENMERGGGAGDAGARRGGCGLGVRVPVQGSGRTRRKRHRRYPGVHREMQEASQGLAAARCGRRAPWQPRRSRRTVKSVP